MRPFLKSFVFFLVPSIVLIAAVELYWPGLARDLDPYWSVAVGDDGKPISIPEKIAWSCLAGSLTLIFVQIVGYFLSAERARRRGRAEMPALLRGLVRGSLFVLAFAIVLKWIWGDEVAPIIGALGVGGIVLGLALQETLSNLFAGLALLAEKPFTQGDWIKVGEGVEGQVEQVTWRATRIRTRENDYQIFPNSFVAKEVIINYRQPTRVHAVRLQVGTSYGDPPDTVRATLLEVVGSVPGVLKDPPPQVYLKSYGDSSINFEIKCFIDDYDLRPLIEDQVMRRVWYALRRRGIEIPFPIRTVYARRLPAAPDPTAAAREEVERLVASSAVFSVLGAEDRARVSAGARLEEFSSDEVVIRQGDAGDSLYGVVSGAARVVVAVDGGAERQVAVLGPGDVFGEMSLLTGEPRTASVCAGASLRVVRVAKGALEPILRQNPDAAVRLAEVVARRRQDLERVKNAPADLAAAAVAAEAKSLLSRIRSFFRLG